MGKKAAAVSGYRLSPNEVAALIQAEKQKRRITRLLQVREQSKTNAAEIRQAVKNEEVRQRKKLGAKLLKEWEQAREAKLQKLEEEYESCLRTIGQGHAEAHYVEKENRDLAKQRLSEKDAEIAQARHREAMLREREERQAEHLERTKQIRARKAAMAKEKERAAKVAALPPPQPDPWAEVELPKHKPVVMVDAEAFSSTYFHMVDEDYAVQKATSFEQVDAKGAAKDEEERVEEVHGNLERLRHERAEKARLRGKHALYKEQLKFEYDKILHDLSDLQREDINRRQREVANIPRSIFQPPHRRLVEKEETQKDMETAFEDMFMKATDQMGDVSLALDPHPMPESPAPTGDLDISREDLTEVAPPSPHQLESKRVAALKDITNSLGDKQKDSSKSLKKLMDRIKEQRDTWISKQTQDLPEHDVTQPPLTVEETPPRAPSSHELSPSQYSITTAETGVSSPGAEDELSPGLDAEAPRPRLAQGVRQVRFGDVDTKVHVHAPPATPKPTLPGPAKPVDDGVLRHPLEEAAKIREAAQRQILSVDKQLIKFETVRAREDLDTISTVPPETSTVGQRARQQRIQLEEHSKEIERKIKELEMKRKLIEERENLIRASSIQTPPSSVSQPSYLSASAPAPVTRLAGSFDRDAGTHTHRAYDWMAPPLQRPSTERYPAPRPPQDHLQRVRDFQRSLLERHKSATLTPSTSFRSDQDTSAASTGFLPSALYGQPGGRPQYTLYPKEDAFDDVARATASRPPVAGSPTSRPFGTVPRPPPVDSLLNSYKQPREAGVLDTSREDWREPPRTRPSVPEVRQPLQRTSPEAYPNPGQRQVVPAPGPAADLSSATRQLFTTEQTLPKRVSPVKSDASPVDEAVRRSVQSPRSLVERPEQRFDEIERSGLEQRLDETGQFSYPYGDSTREPSLATGYPRPREYEKVAEESSRVSPQVSVPTAHISPPHADSAESDDQIRIAEIYERQQHIEERREELERELDEVRRQKKEILSRALQQQSPSGEDWTQKLQEWMAPLGLSMQSQTLDATPDRTRSSIGSEDHTVEIDEKLIAELDQMYSDDSSPESEAGIKKSRPPPLSKKIVYRDDMIPHELSTIQEVETPKSDRSGPRFSSPGTIASSSFATLEPSPRVPSASSTPSGSPQKLITITKSKDGDSTISELIQSQRDVTPVGSPTSVRKQYLEKGYEPSPGGIIHTTPASRSADELRRRSQTPADSSMEPAWQTPSPSFVLPKQKAPVLKEKVDGEDILKRLSGGRASRSMMTPPATWETILRDEGSGVSSGLISSEETRTSSGEERFSSLTSHTISSDQSMLEKSAMSMRERLAVGISGASESSSQSDSHLTGASPAVRLAGRKSREVTQYQISSSESEITETTTSSSMITGTSTEMFELTAYTTTSSLEEQKTSSEDTLTQLGRSLQDLTQYTFASRDDMSLTPSFRAIPQQDLTQYSIASADTTKKSPKERISPKQDLTQYSMVSADTTRVSPRQDLGQYSFSSTDVRRPSPYEKARPVQGQDLTQYSLPPGDLTVPSPSESERQIQGWDLTQYSLTPGDSTVPSPMEKASPMQAQDLTQYSLAPGDLTVPSPAESERQIQGGDLTQYLLTPGDSTVPSPYEKASPVQGQDLTQYSLPPGDLTGPSPAEKASPMQAQELTQYSIASGDLTKPSPSEKASPVQGQDLTQYTLSESTPSDTETPIDRVAVSERYTLRMPTPGASQPSLATGESFTNTVGLLGSMETPGPIKYQDLTQYSLMSHDRTRVTVSPSDATSTSEPSPSSRQQELTQHTIRSDDGSSTPDQGKIPDLTQYSIPSDELSPYEKNGIQTMQELSQHTLTTESGSDGISPRSELSQYALETDSSKAEVSTGKDSVQKKSPQPALSPDLTQISMMTESSTQESRMSGYGRRDLTQYTIFESDTPQQSLITSSDVSHGERTTPKSAEKTTELSQHPISEKSLYPESSPASSEFGTLTPQDSTLAESPSVSSVRQDVTSRSQDASVSQHPLPQTDLSTSQHPLPPSDLSTSQHLLPPSDLSVTQHPVMSDLSTSQHLLPSSDIEISQIPFQTDMSTSQLPLPLSDASVSQHSIPDVSISQHPMAQTTELSISQYPVSDTSEGGTPATSVWLSEGSRHPELHHPGYQTSYASDLIPKDLMSFSYQRESDSDSGDSQTDRIVADTRRLRKRHLGVKSSSGTTDEVFSGEEAGIMDEPELTFSSLVSESTSDIATLTSGGEDEADETFTGEMSESLLSFREAERLVGLEEDSLVSLTPETTAVTEDISETSITPQGALQEAFAKKREAFIKKSQKRVKEVKSKPREVTTGAESLGKTLASWKKSRAINSGTSAVTPSAGARPKTSMMVKTQEDRKSYEKEMKKRTERLYSNLDEVKERKVHQERQKEYAENREKAREYQKKILEKVRKKANGNEKK